MIINEKVAYLKGLIEGANFDTNTTEGKLISEIVNALELIACDREEHEESIDELGAYVDELDGDLAEAEAAIYGDEYEDDCCCDDDDFFEVECPNCKEELCIDEDVLEAGFIECPNCHEKFALEVNEDECGCGCGCEDEDDE